MHPNMSSMRTRVIAWCVAAACAIAALPASAANYSWSNATAGTFNWSTGTNWSSSTAPVSPDTGTIFINNRGASYTVTYDPLTSQTFTSSTGAYGLQVGGGSGSGTVTFSLAQGNLTLLNGGNTQQSNPLFIGNGGVFNLSGSGTLNTQGFYNQNAWRFNQSGGVANLTTSGSANTQFRWGGTGTATVSGGTLNFTPSSAVALFLGADNTTDNAAFIISGGTVNVASTTAIGMSNRGSSTLQITSGVYSGSSNIQVGATGFASTLNVGQTAALFDIQGGMVTNTGVLDVGQAVYVATSTARVTQSGGSYTQSGNVNLGVYNSGSMTLSGGTFAFTGSTFQIGSGTVGQTVAGVVSGSTATAAGVGVLTISNGLFTGTNSGSTSTISVGRTQNDGANTGNLVTVSGGTAALNNLVIFRGGTFSLTSGSAGVDTLFRVSGTGGTGGGLGQVSGGILSITNSATSGALTIERSGTFQVTGGSVTANVFTGTATGASLLVQGGTMTVTRSATSSQPVTIGGGVGPANLALVGSSTSYNSGAFFTFSGGTTAGVTIGSGGLLSSQGKLGVSSPIVIQSGGTMSLASAANAATNGINDGQLSVSSGGGMTVQGGGVLSARSAVFTSSSLNVTGGLVQMTRVAGDLTSELRFASAGASFNVSSGTLSMTSTSSSATVLRLGGNLAGATSGTLSGGAMNLSQFLLGDRGGTFAGDSAADATFTMTGGTLTLDNVQAGGLYVGANPQSTTTPFNRGFFTQGGGSVTNSGVLQIGVNTQGGVSLGTLSLTSGTFTQTGVTQVGVSGSGTDVVGTMAVSGGLFSTTGAFFVGGTSSTFNVGGAVSVTGNGVFTGTNAGRNVTVSVSRTANDATAGNNTFLVNGGTATIDVLNVYRSGTFTLSAGQATVNLALLLSGTTGGAGSGRLTGGTLLVQSGSNTATFTVGQNASFVQSGGSATVDAATITAAGANFAVQAGTFTAGGFTASQPVTIDGTLNLNGATASIGALSGVGTIGRSAAGSGTVSIGDATNSTFAGTIANALGSLGLTKVGAGTLALSGSNTFTGETNVNAGTLAFDRMAALNSSSGIGIAAGAILDYTGAAGTLSRNVTVSSSGTGTIRNSGGQTLTLSGTLTKDGRVLRLTGGTFNVTGQIVGASENSDLLVDGTSAVTLSTVNSYNGPTFVNQASTLVVGVNNAIPNNSTVTLGDATTRGTLDLGSNSDAIGGLVFSGSGGTVRMAANQTASPQLSSTSALVLGANASLDLAGMQTSAGRYQLVSYTSASGTFGSVSGLASGYQLVYGATQLDAQQQAVLGTVAATNPAVSIITGGSAAFTYSVANNNASGGASLIVTGTGLSNVVGTSSGTAAGGGSTGPLSGLVFTGTSVGNNQQGTFSVNTLDAFGSTTSTGTVAVTVLDHATSSLASGSSAVLSTVLNLGTWDYGANAWTSGTNSAQFSIFNLASTFGAGLTADLSLLSVSGTGNGFTTNLDTYADIAGGSSRQYSVFVNPASFLTSGTQSVIFTIAMSDKTGMSGAAASNTLSVTANVVVVPEPGALALAGLGIAAAAWALRRRT